MIVYSNILLNLKLIGFLESCVWRPGTKKLFPCHMLVWYARLQNFEPFLILGNFTHLGNISFPDSVLTNELDTGRVRQGTSTVLSSSFGFLFVTPGQCQLIETR